MQLAYIGRMQSRLSVRSTGRERTQYGPMGIVNRKCKKKKKNPLSVTVFSNRRDSGGRAL